MARQSMNDFRLGLMKDKDDDVVYLTPEWCLEEHKKTLESLNNVCKEYPDYSIVVVTHHCPSEYSIPKAYSYYRNNSSYASDLTDFIVNHPNIKAWVCGHGHTPHKYRIGNCQVFSNPRGYVNHGEINDWDRNTMNFGIHDGIVTEYWVKEEGE